VPGTALFFGCEKRVIQTGFLDFRVLFGIIFGSLLLDFVFFGGVSRIVPAPVDSPLEPFWGHFSDLVCSF
jgi:hypothetical protein